MIRIVLKYLICHIYQIIIKTVHNDFKLSVVVCDGFILLKKCYCLVFYTSSVKKKGILIVTALFFLLILLVYFQIVILNTQTLKYTIDKKYILVFYFFPIFFHRPIHISFTIIHHCLIIISNCGPFIL